MKKILFSALMVTALILSTSGLAYADGIIIPDPPPGVPPIEVPNLAIKYHHVEVNIDNQVATTEINQRALHGLPWGRLPTGYCWGRCSECSDSVCPDAAGEDRSAGGVAIPPSR